MKKVSSISLAIILIVTILTSCSKNSFTVRKNYQPRVKIEARNHVLISKEKGLVTNQLTTQNIPLQPIPINIQVNEQQPIKVKQEKETLLERMAGIFVPKKKELLKPVFHPQKKTLRTARSADDRIVGLIINLLALTFAIVSLLMIIGMAHGNVWVCFVVAMVFACAAIVMGFVGRMLAFKGIGLLAGILGILAVMTILIFLLLITVVGIVF